MCGNTNKKNTHFVLTSSANCGKYNANKTTNRGMTVYELKISPKLLALATVGAATLGLHLDEALIRPIVTPSK
jgi:hypothetical protein